MFHSRDLKQYLPHEFYRELSLELQHYLSQQFISNLANSSSLLFHFLKNVNWVGFYLFDGKKLYLGPFHGKPACLEIALGKGVCGSAAEKMKTLIVPDVSKFPGHISCDSSTQSEIVIPMIYEQKLLGVLDIDSPSMDRFHLLDQKGLETIVLQIIKSSNISQ